MHKTSDEKFTKYINRMEAFKFYEEIDWIYNKEAQYTVTVRESIDQGEF